MSTFFSKIFSILFPPYCYSCKKEGFILCPQCLQRCRKSLNTPAPYITSIYSFKDPVIKKAVHSIKYFHRKDLIVPLISPLIQEVKQITSRYESDINWILIPIPMPRLRKYIRGYNQAELIAKEISKQNNLPVKTKILARSHSYKRQVTTHSRSERLSNQHNTFKVSQSVKDFHIILIDDVTTTGATLSEARTLLMQSGAKVVQAITIAH